MPRINRKRRENGEDVSTVPTLGFDALGLGELFPPKKFDRFALKQRNQRVAERARCESGLFNDALADEDELLRGRERLPWRAADARVDLPTQAADALHEELVEIRAENCQKTHALK